jgi:diguanylate cyclase (GGDEF)-like protein
MNSENPTATRMARRGAIRLALAYFLLATAWILGSDHLAALLARSAEQLRWIQSVKGVAFVAAMTVVVGLSAWRLLRAEAARQQALALAATDPVTRLPNARAFYAALARELTGVNMRCVLMLVDFRNFARINATYGRDAGDQALFNIGRRLLAAAGENAQVARLEKDKFALLTRDAGREHIETLTRQIAERFRGEMRVGGHSLLLDMNIGYALAPEDGADVAALLDAADLALRAAKHAGHGTSERFRRELQQTQQESFHLEGELRQALNERALDVQFQPQFELASGALVGAEALLRWTHPVRGPISPAVFIPVAESSGLIDRVGEFVLDRVCHAMQEWRRAGLPVLRVAVNVAGHQLDDERLGFFITHAASEWDVPLSSLEVEITETMAMRNPEQAVDVLSRLRALGVTIALDDFGTGYSSLSYLLQLPVDKLKIDRSFVDGIDREPSRHSFVRALIGLGRDLGIRVVAEGVETETQRDALRELGCELGQGFLLGRPVPLDEFTRLLGSARVKGIGSA